MIVDHGGMSVRIDADRIARTADGGVVVWGPSLVEPLSGVTHWTLNRSGNDSSDMTVASGGIRGLAPGEHRCLAKASPGGMWPRPDYWGEPSRSGIATMLPIVCVPWAFPSAPFFRPPVPGTGLLGQHLRSEPILRARCRVNRLPRVIEWHEIPGAPTAAQLLRIFRDFHGELFDGWSTDTRTPGLQNPGYGTAWASVVSQALCFLCSTAHIEAKRPLAEAMAQWGLDMAAVFGDGRRHFASGGHMAGRLALIVLAGHLIEGAEALLAVRQTAEAFNAAFMEDAAFPPAPERWRHSTPIDWADPWLWSAGQKHQRVYIDQVTGAQIGTALAMHLLERTAEMGLDHWETCRWWMGPPAADDPIRAAYARHGITPTWGQDYAMGFGAGVCGAAWRQVFG